MAFLLFLFSSLLFFRVACQSICGASNNTMIHSREHIQKFLKFIKRFPFLLLLFLSVVRKFLGIFNKENFYIFAAIQNDPDSPTMKLFYTFSKLTYLQSCLYIQYRINDLKLNSLWNGKKIVINIFLKKF